MLVKNFFSKLALRFNKYKPFIASFLSGKLYPFIVAALVLIGYISGIEFYLNIPIILATCLSLFVCDSVKPFLPALLMVVYQINLKHSPGIPMWSDYYLTGARPVLFVILVIIVLISVIYYSVKNVFPKLSFRHSPLLLPILILSAAFALNGAFSSAWSIGSLVYGAAEILVFFFLFYFLYYGLEKENSGELIDHVCYLTMLVAMVLVGQMAFVYLTYDNIFAPDGSIIKESIMLGWGVNNSVGFALTVLIPMLMRGAMKDKYPYLYLATAVMTWVAALLTLSRNSWIFATLALGAGIIIACFFSERKNFYRILTVCALAVGLIGILAFWAQISSLFSSLLSTGFGDNGRFELWAKGIDNFLSSPLFGTGFFGYGDTDVYVTIEFLPTMAHNTAVQLLSGMGIFGFLAYVFYRVKTIEPIIKKPTYEKCMLFLVIGITLGASLLDNFIFYFLTAFQYILALVLIFKLQHEENNNKIKD